MDLLHSLNSLPTILPAVIFGFNHDFQPLPGTRPISTIDAIAPVALFYLALCLLFPGPAPASLFVRALRTCIAIVSAALFLALPYRFFVPGSAILSYQLGLVGWYGGPRVLDIFIVSRTIPKRIKHVDGQALSLPATTSITERLRRRQPEPSLQPDVDHTSGIRLSSPEVVPHEQTLKSRLLWALDLMTAMRGCGWDWASADVRHSTRSWHPLPADRVYALLTYILPSCLGGASVMKHIYAAAVAATKLKHPSSENVAYSLSVLPLHLRLLGVAATGVTLYTLFDASYTIAAICLSLPAHYKRTKLTEASSTNNLSAAPALNPLAATSTTSVRSFWSRSWHRLFARLFLVWGARPGQAIAVRLGRAFGFTTQGDVGKVIGAFAVSAVVHGQGERAALGARSGRVYNILGMPLPLGGEPLFFMLSAVGVIVEEAVARPILARRRRQLLVAKAGSQEAELGMERWYDRPIGAAWAVTWLLLTGTFFVEGWVASGIWRELTFS